MLVTGIVFVAPPILYFFDEYTAIGKILAPTKNPTVFIVLSGPDGLLSCPIGCVWAKPIISSDAIGQMFLLYISNLNRLKTHTLAHLQLYTNL